MDPKVRFLERHGLAIALAIMGIVVFVKLNRRPEYRTVEHQANETVVTLHGPGWPIAAYNNHSSWNSSGDWDGKIGNDPYDPNLFKQFENDDEDGRVSVWLPNGAIGLAMLAAIIAAAEVTTKAMLILARRCYAGSDNAE